MEDVGLRHADDDPIWLYSLNAGAVIVTKDEDFPDRSARDPNGPVIVWLRVGNTTNRALLEWLQPRWPDLLILLDAGHRLVEVR